MKKLLYFVIPVKILFLLGIFFLSNKSSETMPERKSPLGFSITRSVDIPYEITFAGEKVELSRYDIRERYDREINSFAYFHSTTLLLIKRANRIFPMIEPILKKNGIPDDFKYLAAIESLLDYRAVSPAKAVGLWQILASTGKSYGLEISSDVDERYSIEASTEAACKYLNEAYRKYGSWASTALSYNAGMGRISGELGKQQADESLDLWLVEETSRYYFRMLAIKSIFESPYQYGFAIKSDQLYKPMDFKEIRVSESISDLAEFAKNNGITYAQLKDFNSWLRDRKLIINPKSPRSYTILIPEQKSLYYKKGEKVKVHNKNWVTE